MKRVIELKPGDALAQENMGVILVRMGRSKESLEWLLQALQNNPENANLHDGLCTAYGRLAEPEKARYHGEQALSLKDKQASRVAPLVDPKGIQVKPFEYKRSERNVISFSLWGDKRDYLEGAIRNARLAPEIYPEWRCRFYCGKSVSELVIGELISCGADIVLMPDDGPLFEGLFWRFQVAWDCGVDRFLVRDADSVIRDHSYGSNVGGSLGWCGWSSAFARPTLPSLSRVACQNGKQRSSVPPGSRLAGRKKKRFDP
jgi:tetratricopeptide (TPR) repeat protein